jgi:hypothetical protein
MIKRKFQNVIQVNLSVAIVVMVNYIHRAIHRKQSLLFWRDFARSIRRNLPQ